MTVSSQVAHARPRLHEKQRERLQGAVLPGTPVFGTVASYTAGSPRVVTVTIRDPAHPVTAQWVANSYTPVVGDRVLCVWVGNQLAVIAAGG